MENYFYVKLLKTPLFIFHKLRLPNVFCNYLEDYIDQYIQNKILFKYMNKSRELLNKHNFNYDLKNSGIIWIFWWQGYKDMPPIVNMCIKSIKRHSTNHKVILVDKNNIDKYSTIPDYIYYKLNKEYIDLTHFSDILRFNLLNNYGGLWLDSTMYCSSDLNNDYFKYLYTTGGYKNTIPRFVLGRWASFLIGGNKNNPLFQFMNNYFNLYWKYNNYQTDYFMMDRVLKYAYDYNIGNFKKYVNKYAINNNPHLFDLVDYLNDTYDSNIFKHLSKDTDLFKLTYKKNYNINNKNTFYKKLINEYSNE